MSKEEKIEVQEAPEQLGEVCIADDVVTVIAALEKCRSAKVQPLCPLLPLLQFTSLRR